MIETKKTQWYNSICEKVKIECRFWKEEQYEFD